MQRIDFLRQMALDNNHSLDEFFYKFYKHYSTNKEKSEYKRYADAYYHAFSNLTPSILDGELIVGKYTRSFLPNEEQEWNDKYCQITKDFAALAGGGQCSHMTVDYPLLLKKGINGVIDTVKDYLADSDGEKAEFYKSCIICLEAVKAHSERYSALAKQMADSEINPSRRAELEEIALICKKVPAEPAESFYEAIQSVHFLTHCLSVYPFIFYAQQFQLGHPDRYLLPYYEADIKNGKITKEFAQLLLDCLGIQINFRVPSGLSSGYLVGGRNENGEIVQNELTEMCMQVIDDVRLVYPAVGLCYTQGMNEKYLKKACEILLKGRSHPAIFNDDIISKGLISYCVPEKDAHNYVHSTCVEITPVAASNVWVASPYHNMAQLLLDCLDRDYASFEELLSAYFSHLDQSIKIGNASQCQMQKSRAKYSLHPLLSCFVNDCLKDGIDIEKGGARYNWIMPSFVGMGNLVDSLYAIKTLIFDKKELTFAQLKAALDNNFVGFEALRQRILNDIPKYGNDIDDIDSYYGRITEHIISECKKHFGIHKNGNVVPSVFCWEMHMRFGLDTGATPDGRVAGFPLGDGSGPCQGREMNGPTASILSSTKWAHHELIGGVAVNMKFSKKSLGQSSVDTMVSLVKTYMMRGGFEIQINVLDGETLKKAKETPELYRDLVVRVGGYSDYFTRLTPQMQDEVILRTEHKI